jgi:predicted O-methyltransferase YrrM
MDLFKFFASRSISHRPVESCDNKHREEWGAVEHYIAEHFVPSDPELDFALQASQAAGLPRIGVSPGQGKLLMLLARTIGARSILEVGTLAGYSTIWLARALEEGGKLITLEANADYAKIALDNITHAGLADRVDMRLGRALDLFPTLAADSPFDLVFIDADHVNMADYFQWALKLSHRGSLIVVDNVVRRGKILDAESTKANIQGIRRFYDVAAAERKVIMTAIQTIGVKGQDGFAIALVSDDPSSPDPKHRKNGALRHGVSDAPPTKPALMRKFAGEREPQDRGPC